MTKINPTYKTKWQKARAMFNAKMAEFNNDGSKAIQYFTDEAARMSKMAKEQPQSVAYLRAKYAENAATYGINLAFGTDLASK